MGKPEHFPSETVKPVISKTELVKRLSAVLPQASLLHETEDLKPFECDGLSAYRKVPLAVALPENEDQVRAVLKVCHQGRVPVVFRGAGTGLSGGAMPYEHGLLLGLSKLQRILEVDFFHLHDEVEGRPLFPTPETLEDLTSGADGEGG